MKLWLLLKSKSFGFHFMQEPRPEKWVFILGCYNSGTTLLHKLLAAHPDIGSMPNEGQFYTSQLPRGADVGLPRLWALMPEYFYLKEDSETNIDLNRLKREWAWFYNHPRKKVLIEKTIVNSARSRWLQRHFSDSYFIIIFRNGYAVSEGIHRKEGHGLDIAARQWAVSNEILLNDMDSLQNKYVLTYENLVRNPELEMAGITAFLGLKDIDKSVFEKEFSIHKLQSGIKDMNIDSLGRLNDNDIREINRCAKEVLVRLNYPLLPAAS